MCFTPQESSGSLSSISLRNKISFKVTRLTTLNMYVTPVYLPVFPGNNRPPTVLLVLWLCRIGYMIMNSKVLWAALGFYRDNPLPVVLTVWYTLHCLYPPRNR